MTISASYHVIAILCKSCNNKWSLQIPLSGNRIEAFAAVCDCSALIVGNYNYHDHQIVKTQDGDLKDYQKKIYLTNGHFEILDLSKEEINDLPSLLIEINKETRVERQRTATMLLLLVNPLL